MSILVLAACGGGESFSEEDARAVVEAYLAASDAGDVDAMVSTLTSDAVISTGFGDDVSPTVWAMVSAHGFGEGTIFTRPACNARAGDSAASKTVDCAFDLLNAATQAVEAEPIATSLIAVVSREGISRLAFSYEAPGPNHVGPRFNQWLAKNHPEVTPFGAWTSVEEARQSGEVRAQLAQEWASHLEASGCTFRDDC